MVVIHLTSRAFVMRTANDTRTIKLIEQLDQRCVFISDISFNINTSFILLSLSLSPLSNSVLFEHTQHSTSTVYEYYWYKIWLLLAIWFELVISWYMKVVISKFLCFLIASCSLRSLKALGILTSKNSGNTVLTTYEWSCIVKWICTYIEQVFSGKGFGGNLFISHFR